MATETKASPKTSTFSIEGPYLSAGRVNIDLARTDLLWLSLKINAEGGENAVHAHTAEDHSFIVLEGEVTFYDEHGEGKTLGAYEGIMIPKGAYYRYLNTGGRNLFLLRVGARRDAEEGKPSRHKPDGSPILGDDAENFHIDGVPIPGKSFGNKGAPLTH
ncbi:MAG: cupin domain-containing protein [Chloroflexi bacterium]|nr:cupin domain-containing protein [Chloroflexota bacterium]MCI0816431.1 cupin domain-containing protein [Chloroflexota bacterium]